MFVRSLVCARSTWTRLVAFSLLAVPSGCLGERGGAPLAESLPIQRQGTEQAYATTREDVPLPLGKLLGHAPPDVEALLGEPVSKGFVKKTCVRFAPERTFFRCEFASQTYADKTGTFNSVSIDYEDGLSSRVAFHGLPGAGPLSWQQALEIVGLELPNPPRTSKPADDVVLWRWYNGAARLLIHERQFRVEISIVEDDRKRAKIDVILNHPLSPEQEAKSIEVQRAGPGTGEFKPPPPITPPSRSGD